MLTLPDYDARPLLLACLLSLSCLVLVGARHSSYKEEGFAMQQTYLSRHPLLPTFLTTEGNVTVQKGQVAVLPCAVENRGTRTVVWRKASSRNPITIGRKIYVSDNRYKVDHPKHSLKWDLHIENVRQEDEGVYECQVAAVPKNIRQHMQLNVIEYVYKRKPVSSKTTSSSSSMTPQPDIVIKGTVYVERGNTLKLQCNATGNEYRPEEIDWFKDGNKLKSGQERGRVVLQKSTSLNDRTITSSLEIRRGHMGDAGTYVCRTSDLQVTSVKVNMLNTDTTNFKRESKGNTKKDKSFISSRSSSSSDNNSNSYSNSNNSSCKVVQNIWLVLFSLLLSSLLSSSHRSSCRRHAS